MRTMIIPKKLTIVASTALLLLLLLLPHKADAAAAMCDGICEIDLGMTCLEVEDLLEFAGECCALQEKSGFCYMITTESCQYKDKGADDLRCTRDEHGEILGCVPAYMVYYANTADDVTCPPSDYFMPGYSKSNSPSVVPISSEGPSLVPISEGPSEVDSEGPSLVPISEGPSSTNSQGPSLVPSIVPSGGGGTSATVDISGLETDIVKGAVPKGDCFFVERHNYDTIWTNDCNDKILEYTYYNGGLDAEYHNTGYELEVYARIRTHYRSCPSQPTPTCNVTVDGYPNTKCDCTFDGTNKISIDMDECASAFPEVFARDHSEPTETVAFFFGSTVGTYDEQFYPIDCGDLCCGHPYHATTAPSVAPTGTWVPVGSGGGGASSSATIELIDGDVELGDCYTVERYSETETFEDDGCTATFLKFTYYNGGVNGDYVNTGVPKEEYLKVEVDAMHDCDDPTANRNHCSIRVDEKTSGGGVNTCDECAYDKDKIILADCHNIPGVFAPEGEVPQSIALFGSISDGEGNVAYEDAFFKLRYDHEKCMNEIIISSIPSSVPSGPAPSGPGPTLVPISDSPSSVQSVSTVPSTVPSGPGPTLVPVSDSPSLGETSLSPSLGETSLSPSGPAPSGPGPTLVPVSEAPSLVPSIFPSGLVRTVSSSKAASDIVQGDVEKGDCYTVEQYKTDTVYSDGCKVSFLKYTYYNGGVNAEYKDTKFRKEEYFDVEVKIEQGCHGDSPDSCATTVHTAKGNRRCDACSFDSDSGKVTLEDCSNAGSIFPPGSQTVALDIDLGDWPYEEEFFKLAYNEDRCLHPALVSSRVPSVVPSLVPVSEAPSIVPSGVKMISSLATSDRVPGDASLGDCYSVERELTDTIYSDGCTKTALKYTYYDGGVDVAVVSPGITYETVEVKILHGCDDQDEKPNSCSVSVGSIEGTCACHYSMGEVTMTTCASFEGVLAAGSHSADFFFDGAPESPYDEEFFPLVFDQDKCDNLKISGAPSTFPSLVPSLGETSMSPSLGETSLSPSLGETSMSPSGPVDRAGDLETKVTLPISVTFHYFFKPGKGAKEPDGAAISVLVDQTIEYFQSVFMSDKVFSDLLVEVKALDIEHDYKQGHGSDSRNQFTLAMEADVVLEAGKVMPSSRDAAALMAGPRGHLTKYLHQYVKKNPSGPRTTFFDVEMVRFTGHGTEHTAS